jgi:hypothetical protein
LIGNGKEVESGNINFINVENLYYESTKEIDDKEARRKREGTKMSYSDYCALTEDFMTYRIDEDAIGIVCGYGYERKTVIESLNKGEINHATCTYYLLINSTN